MDIDEAVDTVDVPIDNGGSYRVIGLRIHGDSMKPYLEPGDTAFVACEPSLIKPGRAIGIYLPDSGSVVKEYVRTLPSGEILLRSMNSVDEADYFVAPIGARVYGPVVKRLKGG